MIQATKMRIEASDITGQKRVTVADAPVDASVGELIDGLVPRMNLPRNDNGGNVLTYHARLEREGRHLHSSEVIGEALQPNDSITLQPDIQAG